MSSTRRDEACLLDMLPAAEDAIKFAAGLDEIAFRASLPHPAALVRQLEIVGEAARRVSIAFRENHQEIPWAQIIGRRHRLIHEYNRVNLAIVWEVIRDELNPLMDLPRPLIPPDE